MVKHLHHTLLLTLAILFLNAHSGIANLATPTVETQATCSTASAIIIPENGKRLAYEIRNISVQAVFICKAAVCTAAIGNSYKENDWKLEDAFTYTGPVSCITAASSATVYTSEVSK